MMGASAPHPHGQVWTVSYVPDEVATELANLEAYAAAHREGPSSPQNTPKARLAPTESVRSSLNPSDAPRRPDGAPCLLCEYAHAEVARRERVVALDELGGWVAVVPFWACWPFETLLLPYKRHISSLSDMTDEEDAGLARVLKALLVRYDNLFQSPFPYSMGVHQAPFAPVPERSDRKGEGEEDDDEEGEQDQNDAAHIHVHFYPPLLRSAGVRKFLVGFEMLGEAQRDLTPEQAAARLRAVSAVHYLEAE